MHQQKLISSLCLTLALITSCSSDMKVRELPLSSDPQVELDRVDKNIQQAKNEQVDVLSPKYFKKSKENLKDAVDGRAKNKDQKYVLHNASVAQAYLDRANTNATIARQIMPDTIDARKKALDSNAYKNFPLDVDRIDKNLMAATEQIERDDTALAKKDKDQLKKDYQKIELSSVKKEKLGYATQIIEKSEKEGAKKLTPKTFDWAQKQLSESEKQIDNNLSDEAKVQLASVNATAAANRLLKMVREAKIADNLNPEDLAKRVEKSEQQAMASEQELKQAEADLTSYNNKLVNASVVNENLESKVSLEKKYETARSELTESEAEVYKQGNSIVMRLKGLSFPNNKSTITTENFALLAKVQKIIQETNPAAIKIEGHTDSLGNKKSNEELSALRAESVLSYLVANNNIDKESITSVGFGDTKPISTNKTAVGRAQNRRVDVILSSKEE